MCSKITKCITKCRYKIPMPKCQIKFWIIPLKEHIILPAKVTFHKAVNPHISECVSHIHCTFKLDIC